MSTFRPIEVYVDLPLRFGGRDPSVGKTGYTYGHRLPTINESEFNSFLTRLEAQLEERFGRQLPNRGGLSIHIDHVPMRLNNDVSIDTFGIENLGFDPNESDANVPYEAVLRAMNFTYEAIHRWYQGVGHAYGEDLSPPEPPLESNEEKTENPPNLVLMGPDFGDD